MVTIGTMVTVLLKTCKTCTVLGTAFFSYFVNNKTSVAVKIFMTKTIKTTRVLETDVSLEQV